MKIIRISEDDFENPKESGATDQQMGCGQCHWSKQRD